MTSSGDDTPSEPPHPRAIVAGHGSFPDGLVDAVDQITGRGDLFVVVSNAGLSGEDIEGRLREQAARSGARVFFTDLSAGSATIAVRRLMRADPDLSLVTGANLTTLLEFVFQTDSNLRAAAGRAADKGRASLIAYGGR
jgi:PTS system N-acetylgalactosamine-specific IIA component